LANFRFTFKKLDNVNNPHSIHGIYPYRGKISAIDAKQVIRQLPEKGTLLDPFCGSGTIIYEANKHGLDCIGVDSNPIAIQLSKAKFTDFNMLLSLKNLISIINTINLDVKIPMPEKARKYFHEDTANQIMHLKQFYDEFNDYEKAVFLGTVCLAARGCNGYNWSSTQIGKVAENKTYFDFFKKFLMKMKKHSNFFDSKTSTIIHGDARKLSSYIDPGTVDFVYTSPPYFDGLDYTSNYTRIIHYLFETDIPELKKSLIQNYASYSSDMQQCFKELIKVTNNNALIIFVVGDKKSKDKLINGGHFFSEITPFRPDYIIEREYTGTASKIWDKINKTNRKEQIIVWDKSKW
jgi:DNA modification methylase